MLSSLWLQILKIKLDFCDFLCFASEYLIKVKSVKSCISVRGGTMLLRSVIIYFKTFQVEVRKL